MKVKTQFGEYKISRIEVNKYEVNKAIAIQLYSIDEEYGFEEPFARLTVNITNYRLNDNEAFVDINNCPWARKFIEEYELGHETGAYESSGYCRYPLYEFDLSKLKEYEVNEDEEN